MKILLETKENSQQIRVNVNNVSDDICNLFRIAELQNLGKISNCIVLAENTYHMDFDTNFHNLRETITTLEGMYLLAQQEQKEFIQDLKNTFLKEKPKLIQTISKINDYQVEAMRTANGMNQQINLSGKNSLLLNGVMGLNGEAGECVDIVKKSLFQGHPLDKEHLAKELGDVAWYLAITAQAIDYPLAEIFQLNINKLENRYPDGFDKEKSIHRKKGDI